MSVYKNLQENFERLIKNDQLSHAYLFFGEEQEANQEKFTLAQSIANFLENGLFEKPENILKETLIISPDEKGVIGIDKIRILRYYLWQKPVASSRRLVIIENAENLTPEAQNAALKIVEEPPEAGLIIFIAKTSENLFPTLISRLQKVYFSSAARMNIDSNENKYKRNIDELTLSEFEVDKIFEDLLRDLSVDKIKNSQKLKEALSRFALIKQFNTNKKLQWRSLDF